MGNKSIKSHIRWRPQQLQLSSNALRSVCCVPASVSTTQDQEGVACLIPWPQRVVRRRDERTGMPPMPEVA